MQRIGSDHMVALVNTNILSKLNEFQKHIYNVISDEESKLLILVLSHLLLSLHFHHHRFMLTANGQNSAHNKKRSNNIVFLGFQGILVEYVIREAYKGIVCNFSTE